ncbi:MAG: LLM class flavin-dependent oxidoreductase [Alphaproteobacteria bacterium]|nr:LLM class flavin-dependent oxidoreductase [Alphaproteobacteria bacterium]
MRFSYTHHMPYTDVTDPGPDWPVGNKRFDGERGAAMFKAYVEDKVYAEQAGFDWIGSNEHHMSPYGLMPNPNLVGAIVAHRTKSAGILQSGNILPIVNPVRVAEEYAMIDVISGGRLIAGFMRGIPHEYVAYNTPPDESYDRMAEGVELIKRCWTEPEPFGWEGEHYQFRAVSIWPKPLQKPMPPMLMSTTSEPSARLAAKHRAIAGILSLTSMDDGRKVIGRYRELAREYGWEPGPEHLMVGLNCCIAPSYDEAKQILSSGQEYFFKILGGGIRTAQRVVVQKTRYFLDEKTKEERSKRFVNARMGASNMTFDERVEAGLMICGTPEMAVRQIERLHKDLGMGRLSLTIKVGNVPDWAVTRTMDLLRDEVFPAVRPLGEPMRDIPTRSAA